MTGEFQNTAECLEDIAGSSWKSFMAYQLGGCEVPGRDVGSRNGKISCWLADPSFKRHSSLM